MSFTEREPGIISSFIMWLVDKIDDWYYQHWSHKRWSFGQKWNAMIERLDFEIKMREIEANWAKGLRGNGRP